MKYRLVNRRTKEIIDTIDFTEGPTTSANIRGAKEYFMARKVLEEKDFDNLFTVRPKSYVGRYDWWKEDKSITDDEIKLF